MRIAIALLAGVLASGATLASAAPERPADPTGCRKLPAGQRVVKLNLKPNTDVADLVAWISSVTCKSFLLPSGIAGGKTVTVVSPQLISTGEAYALFLDALDSVGLTVYQSGKFMRVIEVARAKQSPIPLITSEPAP